MYRPAYFHTAWSGRYRFRFVDPSRQARFEALGRDLSLLPLHEATAAVAERRVRLEGLPYAWEADEMAYWLDGRTGDREAVRAERDRLHFTVDAPREPGQGAGGGAAPR